MNENDIKKSTFFGFNENVAAAMTAVLTLVITFVPYVSYFAWAVPIIILIFERKSNFVKLCAVQSAIASALIMIASAAFLLLENAITDEQNISPIISLCGMIISIIKILCAVIMVYVAYNGYNMRETEIPLLTQLIKKVIKYNDK